MEDTFSLPGNEIDCWLLDVPEQFHENLSWLLEYHKSVCVNLFVLIVIVAQRTIVKIQKTGT